MVYELSRIPKERHIRLKRFPNFPSRRIIIPRETIVHLRADIPSRIFFYLRPSSERVSRRLDWHCKCINVCSYRVRQFAFVPGNFSSLSLSRRNFNLGNIFPAEECRSIFSFFFFFMMTLPFINAQGKKHRSLSLFSISSFIINLSWIRIGNPLD